MKFFLFIFLLTGCSLYKSPIDQVHTCVVKEKLTKVHTIDCYGLSETISLPERLKEISQKNFLDPQPFKKVLRIYSKDHQGNVRRLITSYYENGQIKQYLECLNGRANGLYQEWHENGQKKTEVLVIAGLADLDEKAFSSWSFDGPSLAWSEKGVLIAKFMYNKGLLHGPAKTFYPTGEKEKELFFVSDLLEGKEKHFEKNGFQYKFFFYKQGKREGESKEINPDGSLCWKELYENDLLIQGDYFGHTKKVVSSVVQGNGIRSFFKHAILCSQQEIRKGAPKGIVTQYDSSGHILIQYVIENGKKNGPETRYFQHSKKPRLSIDWKEGSIHGNVKTWFSSGQQESQKEYCQNNKQGLCMNWYRDGSIMVVEEYENDMLVKGQYMKKGETSPFSKVTKGSGTASLFDDTGTLIEKIIYENGQPVIPLY